MGNKNSEAEREQQDKDAADAAAQKQRDDEARAEAERTQLVKLVKDGEESLVHPSAVDSHIAAGWKIA